MDEEFAAPRHSPDFRCVSWFDGAQYHFSAMQAAVVEILWRAWENRTPVVSQAHLLTEVDSRCNRLLDLFRRGPGRRAWGTLIIRGPAKGTFQLDTHGRQSPSHPGRRSPVRSSDLNTMRT
jgi:hypothetical protein